MKNEQILTHWKKLHNPDYLGAYSLDPGKDMVLTIRSIGNEMVMGSDGKKEECVVAHFAEKGVKPMILNVTNMRTIASVLDTPYIEEWVGKRIQIFATTVRAFGEDVEALRVRPKPPQAQKPTLDKSYSGWAAARAAVENGEVEIDFLLGRYTIPEDCLEELRGLVPHA